MHKVGVKLLRPPQLIAHDGAPGEDHLQRKNEPGRVQGAAGQVDQPARIEPGGPLHVEADAGDPLRCRRLELPPPNDAQLPAAITYRAPLA